jgi:hypothetical protein
LSVLGLPCHARMNVTANFCQEALTCLANTGDVIVAALAEFLVAVVFRPVANHSQDTSAGMAVTDADAPTTPQAVADVLALPGPELGKTISLDVSTGQPVTDLIPSSFPRRNCECVAMRPTLSSDTFLWRARVHRPCLVRPKTGKPQKLLPKPSTINARLL